ncbi:MAG TPA: hypothetical protein VHQ41_03045, partial [Patescibacteria group bacterium]|nr:hypothetical protein [Patescibacteria group bacterium]
LLFGGKNQGPVKGVLDTITGLIGEGKHDEAIALATTLKPDVGGVGDRDEEKLAEDLMDIMRLGLAPAAKVKELIKFFRKLEKKNPDVMRRLRKGHSAEISTEIRQNKLATAAMLDDDDERKGWLVAAGYFSKTEFELLAKKDKKLFGKTAKAAKAHADSSLAELKTRFASGPRQPRGLKGWLDPFHK